MAGKNTHTKDVPHSWSKQPASCCCSLCVCCLQRLAFIGSQAGLPPARCAHWDVQFIWVTRSVICRCRQCAESANCSLKVVAAARRWWRPQHCAWPRWCGAHHWPMAIGRWQRRRRRRRPRPHIQHKTHGDQWHCVRRSCALRPTRSAIARRRPPQCVSSAARGAAARQPGPTRETHSALALIRARPLPLSHSAKVSLSEIYPPASKTMLPPKEKL